MQDFVLVVIVFLLAVVFSKTSINSVFYQWIKWAIFIFTVITSLLILNVESIGRVAIQLANDLNQLGIGNPKSWEIKTRHFDDLISGCYYVTFFSALFVVILSATYEFKNLAKIRQDLLKAWGALIVFAILQYWFFLDELSPYHSRRGGGLRFLFNTQIGLVAFQYIAINICEYLGISIRAIFARNNLEHESSCS